jgi:hypothetical protein
VKPGGGRAVRIGALVVALLVLGSLVLWERSSHSSQVGKSCSGQNCTRVLFIGDSLTYVNDLPHAFAALAASGHHKVAVDMVATGGATFDDHVNSPDTAAALARQPWDTVVLQEQSQRPLFYLAWAHSNGWPEAGLANYDSMQKAIDQGYLDIANELKTAVAPVGVAWNDIQNQGAPVQLFQADDVHPTPAGTYLAAAVFYATIFGESPVRLHDHGGLDNTAAATLQSVAGDVVLNNAPAWGLNRLSSAP